MKRIDTDNLASCTIYAFQNKLIERDGWKNFHKLAKQKKKILRLANEAKLRSFKTTQKYKYGYTIPRDYQDAK